MSSYVNYNIYYSDNVFGNLVRFASSTLRLEVNKPNPCNNSQP